ncbi:hypothetical protein [Lysobacter gummosus]|uniref:hypothetical protein n=1 Tax=Lysobacter gummosus TaxID=262324 RepID=UPI0036403F73
MLRFGSGHEAGRTDHHPTAHAIDPEMLVAATAGVRVQDTSPGMGASSIRIQGLRGRYAQMLAGGLPLYGGQSSSCLYRKRAWPDRPAYRFNCPESSRQRTARAPSSQDWRKGRDRLLSRPEAACSREIFSRPRERPSPRHPILSAGAPARFRFGRR